MHNNEILYAIGGHTLTSKSVLIYIVPGHVITIWLSFQHYKF